MSKLQIWEGRAMKLNRRGWYCLVLSIMASRTSIGRPERLPMEAHMAIQKGEIEVDQQLAALPGR